MLPNIFAFFPTTKLPYMLESYLTIKLLSVLILPNIFAFFPTTKLPYMFELYVTIKFEYA